MISMKFEMLESSPMALRFKVSGASSTFVNSLRRACINGVKTFAIDSVTFFENTSSIFDEYIAHRVGLVPLITPDGYDEKDEVLFSAEMDGPGTLYSKDLKTSDRKVRVANDNIPLMTLAAGQKLRFDGKAVMGDAARSAKFQPGFVTYKSLGKSDDEYEFYVESFGQVPALEIIKTATEALKKDMKVIYKELDK